MYREGRGTWFNARYVLDHPSSYNLEYDREEPRWNLAPPAQAYSDELRMFPRSEENVPEWLMRRMSGVGAEQPAPRFRVARIFDGQDASGRPVLHGALKRAKATPQQVGLDKSGRAQNVQGAFRVPPEGKAEVAGRRLVLVDDVLTSGATVDACTRALLRGGAAAVDVLVFARVVAAVRTPI